MDWNAVKEFIKEPAFIVGIAGVVVVLILLVIFSNTTVGKKAFNKVKSAMGLLSGSVGSLNVQINTIKDDSKKIAKSNEEFQEKLLGQLKEYFNFQDAFALSIYEIISEIPNAKVQAKLEEFKKRWKDHEKEIASIIGVSYNEIQNQLKVRDGEIARLSDKVSELEEFIDKNLNSKESGQNGERIEGTNN